MTISTKVTLNTTDLRGRQMLLILPINQHQLSTFSAVSVEAF